MALAVIRSILALVVVLAMAAAVGVVFAMFASPRSVRGRGRLRCHQVRGGETKSRSNTMMPIVTGAAPQPIEAR